MKLPPFLIFLYALLIAASLMTLATWGWSLREERRLRRAVKSAKSRKPVRTVAALGSNRAELLAANDAMNAGRDLQLDWKNICADSENRTAQRAKRLFLYILGPVNILVLAAWVLAQIVA